MLAACDWALAGHVAPSDGGGDAPVEALPASLLHGAVALSGLFDMAPLRKVPSLQRDLNLDADAETRLSPVRWPAPGGPVAVLVGGDESEQFVAQSRQLQAAWGEQVVPVCEAVPGHNHFSILTDLADPAGRSHAVVRKMLGLAPAEPLGGQ
jgi:arylformamidase